MRTLRPLFFLSFALFSGHGLSLVRATESAIAGATLTREHALALLSRDLTAHFNLEGELQLESLRAWTPSTRTASVWELNVVEYPNAPASSMLVRCRVLADSVPISETTFVLRASLWRDAWATRQPLTIGETFSPSALEARRVDLLRERDVLPASAGDESFIFARAVSAGRLLTWRDISRRPLVKKGDLVDVSAADGFLVVTMKALAMQNGAKGETVTVRNPESRKDFAAMVIDENRVQVRF
jgi:flagellar basal body P-ring formation protein FlgA